jgi:hypothetical protein
MSEENGLRYLFDERYAEAMLHKPGGHRVLGKRLKPFSMWHKLQLEYSQSKILLGGAGIWDLWCAVQICRTQYPERVLWEPRWGGWNPLWHRFWKMKYGKKSLAREIHSFVKYAGDYQSGPKMWGGKGSAVVRYGEALEALGEALGDKEMVAKGRAAKEHGENMGSSDRDVDETLEQIMIAVKLGGLSLEKAWNMPLGELGWLNVCLIKMEGGKVNVWTPMEEQKFEEHKKVRHEKIAKLAEEIGKKEEHAGETQEKLMARAAVEYWERVVRNVS